MRASRNNLSLWRWRRAATPVSSPVAGMAVRCRPGHPGACGPPAPIDGGGGPRTPARTGATCRAYRANAAIRAGHRPARSRSPATAAHETTSTPVRTGAQPLLQNPSADRCLALQVARIFFLQTTSSATCSELRGPDPGPLGAGHEGTPMNAMAPPRPTDVQSRHVRLTTGPAAAAEARRQVRAAIRSWDVPVDPDTAVLLACELVTNAIRHETGPAITLVVSCSRGRLRVDVHDTARCLPTVADAPVDAETGRGLMLVATLSDEWGIYRTPAGKAVYFALAFQPRPVPAAGGRGPRGLMRGGGGLPGGSPSPLNTPAIPAARSPRPDDAEPTPWPCPAANGHRASDTRSGR